MGFAGAWGDFVLISATCFLIFGRQQRANADSHRADFMGRLCALHFCNTSCKNIGARTKSSKDIIELPKYVTWAIFRVRPVGLLLCIIYRHNNYNIPQPGYCSLNKEGEA